MVATFALALAAHACFATLNWNFGFLVGHEFRQSQTALITYYIDEQDNFSPRYETPLFGKPWVSNPLEFPLYEWAVVLLSRATDLPHFKAARTVTLLCFYGTLPAVFLLLRSIGLPSPKRLLILSLVLTCPAYIFYSRAFLMESMALMCSAWFLWAFVQGMQSRQWRWIFPCALAGTAAALIKNTTFAVWLLPAAGVCAATTLRAWRRKQWAGGARTFGWGLACVAIPLGALAWWLRFTDEIKLAHPSAYIFSSRNLSQGNFGLLNLQSRFSAETWKLLLEGWSQAIVAPWLILCLLAAGLIASPAHRGATLACTAAFIAAQMLFPFAYALQEYYFYACAVFLHGALGFALLGVLEAPWPKWLRGSLVLLPLIAQLQNYWHGYRPLQVVPSHGGTGLTHALRAYLPPGSIMIVAGADWFASIPYYAQRKALMIRKGLENDIAYLKQAFDDLAEEDVAALVLVGEERDNRLVRDLAVRRFNLDPTPTFSHLTGDVYMHRLYRRDVLHRLKNHDHYDAVTPGRAADAVETDSARRPITPATARRTFPMISPAPSEYQFAYGYSLIAQERALPLLGAHPDTDVWIPPPSNTTYIEWEFGFFPGVYERSDHSTNGVEFIITAETADGRQRQIFRRLLDPVNNPSDRRRQLVRVPYTPTPGEFLVFSTRGNGDLSFDSVYWSRLVVK